MRHTDFITQAASAASSRGSRGYRSGPPEETPHVSIVVPFKNEEATLVTLFDRVRSVCLEHGLTFEVVFVDDGSTDSSVERLRQHSQRHPEIRVISLRRNFGKAAALSTGFRASRGACVISMDADLQDDPAEIPELYGLIDSGYGVVSGWKKVRHDPLSRRLASKVFNAVTRKVSGVPLHDFNCGLKAYSSDAAHEIADTCYGELHRYLPVLAHWRGFPVTEKVVLHHPRAAGASRYGLERYVRGTCDLLTTWYMTKYARRPMHAFGGLALISGGVSVGLLLTAIGFAAFGVTASPHLFVAGGIFAAAAVQAVLVGLVAELVSRDQATTIPSYVVVGADWPEPHRVIDLTRYEAHHHGSAGSASIPVPAGEVNRVDAVEGTGA